MDDANDPRAESGGAVAESGAASGVAPSSEDPGESFSLEVMLIRLEAIVCRCVFIIAMGTDGRFKYTNRNIINTRI
jgi:hypothetical protein